MNGFQGFRNSRWFWFVLLAGLLGVESCLLAFGVNAWMTQREAEPGIQTVREATAVAADPVGFEETRRPEDPGAAPSETPEDRPEEEPAEETPEPQASETPAASPTPTPEPVEFEVPPPGKIVYVCFDGRYDQICLMNADGSDRRQLTEEEATSFYPSLAPDGNQIVFSSNRDGNFEIYMMDTNGRNLVQLTDNLGSAYAPEISPKNNRIAFTLASGNRQDIWVMRMDGGNARPFTDSGSAIDPSWAPDAERILFAMTRQGGNSLYTIEAADGSRPQRVTGNDFDTGGRNDWSPDGERVAFYAGPSGDHEIFTANLDGDDAIQHTQGGDNLGPTYSPDGEWLAFTSFRSGNNDIFVVNLDDGLIYQLTFDQNSDWQPRWGP